MPHETAAVSAQILCTPYNHATYSDYASRYCDHDLENSKPIVSLDPPVHGGALSGLVTKVRRF